MENVIMLQDIKLSTIPTKYTAIKESAEDTLDIIKKMLEEEERISGFMYVLICPDGSYFIGQSEGIDRHRKIGILTEMISELIRQ